MLRILLALGLLAYPVLVYFGLVWFRPGALGVLLALLAVGRWLATPGPERRGLWPLTLVLVVMSLAIVFSDDERLLRAYPVVVSWTMAVMFAVTLWRPPSLIERVVRLHRPELPAAAPPYLWWVTLGWSVFLVINGAVAAWTAWFASITVWAWYNGVVSYVLIAVLMGVEWLTRGVYKRRVEARAGVHD